MENIELSFDGQFLVLTVDCTKELGFTNAGESMRIATSGGNVQLWHENKPHPDAIRFNFNVYRSLREDEREAGKLHGRKYLLTG